VPIGSSSTSAQVVSASTDAPIKFVVDLKHE
jgi:hypothetical protein